MRRSYISPEFNYAPVNGSFNMLEQSSFFGSKMLEIADSIEIKNESIIYYQQSNNEQIDLSIESTLPQIVYDTVQDKALNHTITIDNSQKNNNPRWIINVKIREILKNYIFANLKKYRTFEGIENTMVVDKNVNESIKKYIELNVLNRYKFKKIELYYKPVDLLTSGSLKLDNKFDVNIEIFPNTLFSKIQTETDPEYRDIKVSFYQDKDFSKFSFSYYFNIYFEKL
jgi:hypothetical protein